MRAVVNAPVFGTLAQPASFNLMLNYHLGFANADGSAAQLSTGKRVRPVLVLLACEACGGDALQAMPAAAAVELLHNFSLIHDDIEDGDELRRGRPTLWKVWGVPQAINAGDAMFAQAHLALENLLGRGVAAERVVRVLRVFDAMCVHLTIGQHLDLSFEARRDVAASEYVTMIAGKTAALTKACCEIGAIVGGGSDGQIAALGEFGRGLGLSFQIQDDVLGIWGDPAIMGKAGSDLAHGKKTLPVLFAAERDARVREKYLLSANRNLNEGEIENLRGWIEAVGGRQYAEDAAHAEFTRSLEAWETAQVDNAAGHALRQLAHNLLGRAA
jgi:geranylgeranyl diphosphate synthase type I